MDAKDENFLKMLERGFLPFEPPLRRLPANFEIWELLLNEAQDIARNCVRISGPAERTSTPDLQAWRIKIEKCQILWFHAANHAARVTQRAHHVLTYLVQFYVTSLPSISSGHNLINIPESLAVPLISVSQHLGMAPILTYADTVLWNWQLIDPALPVSASNVRMIDLFTASPQEAHFFLTSLRMEVVGKRALQAMAKTIKSKGCDGQFDLRRLHERIIDLEAITEALKDITYIFCRVQDELDSSFFYNIFRPFIQGADQGSLSPSWSYSGTGLILQPSGPSAGQSAFMHSFDAFLGIKHPHNSREPGSGCAYMNAALNPNAQTNARTVPQTTCPVPPRCPNVTRGLCFDHGKAGSETGRQCQLERPLIKQHMPSTDYNSFNARMRAYMPAVHQNCLLWLESQSPFRQNNSLWQSSNDLTFARSRAVSALADWRDAHIRIVTQYVILPARRKMAVERAKESMTKNPQSLRDGLNLPSEQDVVRGTGGTSLIPLLKIYRDNTRRSVQSRMTTLHKPSDLPVCLMAKVKLGQRKAVLCHLPQITIDVPKWYILALVLFVCYCQIFAVSRGKAAAASVSFAGTI